MKAGVFRRLVNLWPPFLFTGIRIAHISEDYREATVTLKLRWYNRNYVGTHFGGSLFAMTDPMYALLLMQRLGGEYIVWDKHAEIEYVTPGRGKVSAFFRIDDEIVETIREATATGEKYLPVFPVEVVDERGDVVARAIRTLYVRRKAGRI